MTAFEVIGLVLASFSIGAVVGGAVTVAVGYVTRVAFPEA